MMVKTSEFPDAGTHAQVRLTVYGSKSHSGRLILGQGGPNCQDFEAGQISTHRVSDMDRDECISHLVTVSNMQSCQPSGKNPEPPE